LTVHFLYGGFFYFSKENSNNEHSIQENRLPGHRVGINRCNSRLHGGGYGGCGHVHQELCAVQEDVG